MSQALLDVRGLRVSFDMPGRRGASRERVEAVRGVDMSVFPRQTLAVVGESGCGKSVTALSILGLVACPPGRVDGGEVWLSQEGGGRVDLLKASGRELQRVRGGEISMIFQEPMTSLNPVFTVGSQISEAVVSHQGVSRKEALDRAVVAMDEVGIPRAAERLRAYPHEFSGGMRQRVMIAMALACQPRMLIADEPTTALDVTVQAQILDVISRLKEERGLGVLLITHDMGVVAESSDVVCVMYAGQVVEYARVEDLFERPLHPYTRGLLASVPVLGQAKERLAVVHDVIEEALSDSGVHGGLGVRAWWPGATRPDDLVGGDEESVLAELEQGRWVRVWKTPASMELSNCPPRLAPELDIVPSRR